MRLRLAKEGLQVHRVGDIPGLPEVGGKDGSTGQDLSGGREGAM